MLVKNLPMAAKFLTILGVFGIFVVAMASGEVRALANGQAAHGELANVGGQLNSNSAAVKLTMARIALG
jgi:hypothetical protein